MFLYRRRCRTIILFFQVVFPRIFENCWNFYLYFIRICTVVVVVGSRSPMMEYGKIDVYSTCSMGAYDYIHTTYKHLCHVEWIGFVYTSLYEELWSVIRAMDYVVPTAADGMYR